MKNIKLIIEYDGTNYYGWQKQNDKVTIQGTLEEAVRNLTKEENEVIGCSRTDSGVHARGQYHPISLEKQLIIDYQMIL